MDDDEDEDQTSLEELPGILGYKWDSYDFIVFDPCLSAIAEIDPREVEEAQEVTKGFKLEVLTREGMRTIEVGWYDNIFQVFDELTSLSVVFDCPLDLGPAGGSGYLFFLADGATTVDVKREVDSFCTALRRRITEVLASG